MKDKSGTECSPSQGEIKENIESVKYEITTTNTKTKFCKNIETHGKCTRANCGYYHNEKERKIQLCKFNLKCINERCICYHENEDIKEYINRISYDTKYIYGNKDNCIELINNAIKKKYKKIIFISCS